MTVETVDVGRPVALTDSRTHYCPGCGHGIVHRMLAEYIADSDLHGEFIGVAPVGCAVVAYDYIDIDWSEAAHGRTPAVATGIKRVHPDKLVLCYQGDGDLAAIGTAEIVHCANRGEQITVVFVNNAVYGMTGGQMAPTTLVGQKTITSPRGREPRSEGWPLKISEMLGMLDGSVYVERVTITTPAHVRKAKRAIAKAFRAQREKLGFSLVEILSPCPVQWGMAEEPWKALEVIEQRMTKTFPLSVIKDTTGF
jgi:2-oxoglutarate ferredoxin oxidoreductase subunit beta